jgi:hypothetical protein
LAADGLIVGEPWSASGRADDPQDDSMEFAGAAHLYERSAQGTWRHRAYIKSPDIESNDIFGFSTAVAPGLIAIGAPFEAGGPHSRDLGAYSGAVHIFTLSQP